MADDSILQLASARGDRRNYELLTRSVQIDTTLPTLVESEEGQSRGEAPVIAAPFIKSIRTLKQLQASLKDTSSPVRRFK
jgi:hypothetical protein